MEYLQSVRSFGPWVMGLAALVLLSVLGLWCRGRVQLRDRERIWRGAHDELVQGVQGLMLRLQAIAEDIPSQDPARQQLEQLLDRADAMLLADREAPGRGRRPWAERRFSAAAPATAAPAARPGRWRWPGR